MIEYHGDGLVPPELCRLLYLAVPKEDHVPVRFFNRRDAYGKPTGGERRRYSTPFGIFMHGRCPWVGVNLNAVFFTATGYLYPRLASSTAVWRALLEVCLHEFGHAATRNITEGPNRYAYNAEPWGRVHKYTEQLADDWKDRRVARILRYDARLGQPRRIAGYLGARLAEERTSLERGIKGVSGVEVVGLGRAAYVKEQRCWKAGAQLTSGDVLRELGLEPRLFTNAYRVLRDVSQGVGVGYIDGAGGRHRLYAWGDVPVLARRMQERTGSLVPRGEPVDHDAFWSLGDRSDCDPRDDQAGPSGEAAGWDDPDGTIRISRSSRHQRQRSSFA